MQRFIGLSLLLDIGSSLIISAPAPKQICWLLPSSNATANLKASSGVSFGSVHGRCCTVLLFMFWMNASVIQQVVCSPNSHFDANPVSTFQSCLNEYPLFCFLAKNLYLSSVRLRGFMNVCLQFSRISLSVAADTTMYGSLSVIFFALQIPGIETVC